MEENSNYIKLYINVLEDVKLNIADKIIYSYIKNFNESNQFCWISNSILSQKTKLSMRTVQYSINKLINLDYLKKEYIIKGKKRYRFLTPIKHYKNNIKRSNKND